MVKGKARRWYWDDPLSLLAYADREEEQGRSASLVRQLGEALMTSTVEVKAPTPLALMMPARRMPVGHITQRCAATTAKAGAVWATIPQMLWLSGEADGIAANKVLCQTDAPRQTVNLASIIGEVEAGKRSEEQIVLAGCVDDNEFKRVLIRTDKLDFYWGNQSRNYSWDAYFLSFLCERFPDASLTFRPANNAGILRRPDGSLCAVVMSVVTY